MGIDKKELYKLIRRYKDEMDIPLDETDAQTYDEGYIDGIVDLLGDLISYLDLQDLNTFSDEMEELQQRIYDRKVLPE